MQHSLLLLSHQLPVFGPAVCSMTAHSKRICTSVDVCKLRHVHGTTSCERQQGLRDKQLQRGRPGLTWCRSHSTCHQQKIHLAAAGCSHLHRFNHMPLIMTGTKWPFYSLSFGSDLHEHMQVRMGLGRRTLCHVLFVDAVQGVTQTQDLDSTESVQQMGIMALGPAKASIGVLA